MKLVETAILSTDLAMYFKKRNKFLNLIDEGEFDWQSEDKKERKSLAYSNSIQKTLFIMLHIASVNELSM